MDERTKKLAKLLVNYSLKIKEGENVVISGGDEAKEFIIALYKEVLLKGAHPILRVNFKELDAFFYKYAKKHQIEKFPEHFDFMVRNAQKYIGINTELNTKDLAESDAKKITARRKVTKDISHYIVNQKDKIRRCTVGFPCVAFAQEAEMSLIDYEDFVFSSCLQDWDKLGKLIDKVLDVFRKGKKVHLVGENIDLRFDIHGSKAASDKGESTQSISLAGRFKRVRG